MRIKDEALREEGLHILGNKPLSELHLMSKTERDEILHRPFVFSWKES